MSQPCNAAWVRALHIVTVLAILLALGGPAWPAPRVAAAPAAVAPVPATRSPAPPRLLFPIPQPARVAPAAAAALPPALSEPAPVRLELSADPPAAWPGQTFTVTLRVTADAPLPGASVSGTLPPGLRPAPFPGEDPHYDPATRTLAWQLPPLDAGSGGEWRLHLRLEEDAPDLALLRLRLGAPGLDYQPEGQVALQRLYPDVEAEVSVEQGGSLRSADGRVQVTFPAEAVTQTLRVRQHTQALTPLPDGRAGIALQFTLDAATADVAAQPVRRFGKPLTVCVDLAGLVNWDALAFYQDPFLGYWDEAAQQWAALPVRREGAVLCSPLEHFTTIGGGSGNRTETGWVLAFNDAQVAGFTGGLNYVYPLRLPEGRGQLLPELQLSYDSRRIDGILTWIQSDWAGIGWSLDTMEIVRRVEPDYNVTDGRPAWYWNRYLRWWNEFTLLVNGAAYTLTAESPHAYGRYYTNDEQFLYVERRNGIGNNGSPANETSEYWIVRLRDGTTYRLGYKGMSEQIVRSVWDAEGCPGGSSQSDSGKCYGRTADNAPSPTALAFRWRVDQITDTIGNKIEYLYRELTGTHQECTNCAWATWNRASYLTEVRYNRHPWDGSGSRVVFNLADRGADGIGDKNPDYWYFSQDDYLRSIAIQNWDGADYRTVREYVLAYSARSVPQGEHDNRTRRLASITEYGVGGQAGGQALPTTTFVYAAIPNKGAGGSSPWDQESFRYDRLGEIHNGYSGSIWAYYNTPDANQYWIASNQRVVTRTVSDGLGGVYTSTYSYPPNVADRCYDNNAPKQVACDAPPDPSVAGGRFLGYRYITETLWTRTPAATVVATTTRQYQLNTEANPDRRLGRELCAWVQDGARQDLRKSCTEWGLEVITHTAPFTATYFIYPSIESEYLREDGSLPATPQKKRYYHYEREYQGGAQYGNLTQVVEVWPQSGSVYRRKVTGYRANSDPNVWIVDRPAEEYVFDGAWVVLARTAYIYDGLSRSLDDPPLRGRLVKVLQLDLAAAQWRTTQIITYSGVISLPVEVADGNGNVARTTYDGYWTYPLTVTQDPNGIALTTSYAYSLLLGLPTAVTGPNGITSTVRYEYDPFGRLRKVIRPGDSSALPTVEYAYCDTCAPLRITTSERITSGQAAALKTLRHYNGLGQLFQETLVASDDSQMIVSNYRYNAQGQLAEEYLPYYYTGYSTALLSLGLHLTRTSYAYDALGRPLTVTQPDGAQARAAYNGLRQASLDANNHQRLSTQDPFGRVVTVCEYSGAYALPNWTAAPYAATGYGYNRLDLLTRVTDTLGSRTVITYDGLGHKLGMSDPDMGLWSYAYDGAGNLIRQVDARGQAVCLYYDRLNRLTGKTYTTSASCPATRPATATLAVAYQYDYFQPGGGHYGRGLRTQAYAYSTGITTSWKYDERGRLAGQYSLPGAQGQFKTWWSYNARDQVLTQRYPGGNGFQEGEALVTGYDKFGRPSVLSGTVRYVNAATYDALGRLEWLQVGNGQQVDYDYYSPTYKGGRLSRLRAGAGGGSWGVQDLAYAYDAVGNVTAITDTLNGGQAQQFSYDALDRLTAAVATPGADTYNHSYQYDARGNLTSFAGVAYAYQDAGHVHAVTHLGGVQKYSYDANGNMTSRAVAGGTQTLTYDAENHLIATGVVATATFTYDGDGQRALATVGGVTTATVAAWYEWSGGAGTSYYLFGGRRVALRTGAGVTYLYADHLGSTASTQGQAASSERYYPYGAKRGASVVVTPYRYTGQREEPSIGLYYYGARWYDPALGRFVQPDTVVPEPGNPQALNRYSYVLNNPLRYVDPSGHEPDPEGVPKVGTPTPKTLWWNRYREAHGGQAPTEQDWMDYLVSMQSPGTGPGGSWTESDWQAYTQLKQALGSALMAQVGQGGGIGTDFWTFVGFLMSLKSVPTSVLLVFPELDLVVDGTFLRTDLHRGEDGMALATTGYYPAGTGGWTWGEIVVSPSADDRGTMIHEYIHVLQNRSEGFVFYFHYVRGGLYNWYGPNANLYEAQAMLVTSLYGMHPRLPEPWYLKWAGGG